MAVQLPSYAWLRHLASNATNSSRVRSIPSRAIASPNTTRTSLPSRPPRRPHLAQQRQRPSSIRSYSTSTSATGDKSKFAYKIAAAFSGKGEQFDKEKYNVKYDSATGVHWAASTQTPASQVRAKRHKSGQDAFFVAAVGKTDAVAFGVADGVGGYSDQGIDSAAFSHGLCDHMFHSALDYPAGFESDGPRLSPLSLLQVGYHKLCHDESVEGGGSTACVAVAEPEGVLNVANLGDSGFVQLRLNAVHHYSEPQTHAFNTPFQLSLVPPKLLAQIAKFGGKSPFSDMPADADISEHELRHGDILVFATDGVWDNLSTEDILVCVAQSMAQSGGWTSTQGNGMVISKTLPYLTADSQPKGTSALQTQIAVNLVTKSKAASLDKRRNGPFAKAVHKAFPREHWSGGKVDDICVLVAIVLEEDSTKLKAKL